MKKLFVALAAIVAAGSVCVASQLREVRAAWLVPSVEARTSVNNVDRMAGAGFNTVLVRMQTPSGVWWSSSHAPETITASMSTEDVPDAMVRRSHDLRLKVHGVVLPDPDADVDSLTALYREMQLRYGFDGVVIDTSLLGSVDAAVRRDVIDRLTLALTDEFPQVETSVAMVPDRSGSAASEATAFLADGFVSSVYLTDVSRIPSRMLEEHWGSINGIVITYPEYRDVDARFMSSPWGIAYVSPDAMLCNRLSKGLFSDYAHLPQRATRPTVPDQPANVFQEFTGKEYRVSWSSPVWIDEEAPVSYYSVYHSNGKISVVPKTAGCEIIYPSEDPYLRFSVTAWDVNCGESEASVASVREADISDELMPEDRGVEISCVDSQLSLRSASVLGTVDIFDTMGTLVKSRRVNRTSASINCSGLRAGVYVVTLRDRHGEAISQKFLLK